MIAMLITAGIVVAAIAFGESLSLSASRLPRADAENLLDEALSDYADSQDELVIEERARVHTLQAALEGRSLSPKTYLSDLDGPRRDAVEQDLERVTAALNRAAAGENVPAADLRFQEVESTVFFHLVKEGRKQGKGRKKS